MFHVATAHLWFAGILFLASVSLTIFLLALKKKSEILSIVSAKMIYWVEMIFSGLVPLMGLWILFAHPIWMKFPDFHTKLTLAILSILLIHWANAKMRKACKTGNSSFNLILFIRVIALILMTLTYNYGLSLYEYTQL